MCKSIQESLMISIVDTDPDYLGVEIRAWNGKFSGNTYVFSGLRQLSELASRIAGFPTRVPDERTYEFGTRDPKCAGGYCGLCLHTIDSAGHSALDVDIEDEDRYSSAKFRIRVEPAAIDRFVRALQSIEASGSGTAQLLNDK